MHQWCGESVHALHGPAKMLTSLLQTTIASAPRYIQEDGFLSLLSVINDGQDMMWGGMNLSVWLPALDDKDAAES